jgi:class 3 adenylate cyclase
MKVNQLIADVGIHAKYELTTPVDIIEMDDIPDEDEMYVDSRKWIKVDDVVALAGDLTNSTKLSLRKHTNTSARIYEAATGGAIRIVTQKEFGPEFVDIQGDGFFALFHGHLAHERALCAAVSLRTFSERHLVPLIQQNMGPTVPKTGFKAGISSGTLAVKRVGAPRRGEEPVWAGKPVNWAYKCAQQAEIHEVVVTEKVWNKIKDNDYVRWSCGCDGSGNLSSISMLWSPKTVTPLLGHGINCWVLQQRWCEIHGDEFCQAILHGTTDRADVPSRSSWE